MQFMVILKATPDSEAGIPPSKEVIAAMVRFNEELVRAGVLLAADGLHPSSKGARVKLSGGQRTVLDGPFAETKELIGGFWMFEVPSLEEAIAWVKRFPDPVGEGAETEIEIRQVIGPADYPADVFPPEEAARVEAMHEEVERRSR